MKDHDSSLFQVLLCTLSHLIDLYLEEGVSELLVVDELVPILDIFPLGELPQHTGLATGQRLGGGVGGNFRE